MSYSYPKTISEAAELLDRIDPYWYNKITQDLQMSNIKSCVLGQVFGDYRKSMQTIFCIYHSQYNLDRVFGSRSNTNEWNKEINQRKENKMNEILVDGGLKFIQVGPNVYEPADSYTKKRFEVAKKQIQFSNLKPMQKFARYQKSSICHKTYIKLSGKNYCDEQGNIYDSIDESDFVYLVD